jgi:hypothetical protein
VKKDLSAVDMVAAYGNGLTVSQVAKQFNISTGKAYYMLQGAGCIFRPKGAGKGFVMPLYARRKIGDAQRGRVRTPSERQRLSETKKSTYNGLNGYGHTKPHNKGYVRVYVPEHPYAAKDGYVMLHTVLMERQIGRYLHEDEVVHHINHIKDDNRLINLKLMKVVEHQAMHMRERHQKRRDDLSIKYSLSEI